MRMEEIFQGKVTQDKNHRKRYIGIYLHCENTNYPHAFAMLK